MDARTADGIGSDKDYRYQLAAQVCSNTYGETHKRLTDQDGPRFEKQDPACSWDTFDENVEHQVDSGAEHYGSLPSQPKIP